MCEQRTTNTNECINYTEIYLNAIKLYFICSVCIQYLFYLCSLPIKLFDYYHSCAMELLHLYECYGWDPFFIALYIISVFVRSRSTT